MCGRSSQPPPEKLKWHWEPGQTRNANPGLALPGRHIFALVSWKETVKLSGLHWGWDGHGNMYNARCETMDRVGPWRGVAHTQRCVIPLSQFSERSQDFEAADGEVLAAAGLYSLRYSPPTCTMLTRPADKVVARFHHRMPVLLSDHNVERWLRGEAVDREELLTWNPPLKRAA